MSEPVRLSMLDGAAGPEWLAEDLATLAELPPSVHEELWTAIELSIVDPMPKVAESFLTELCTRHAIEPALLARALKAIRYMYRAAAQTASPKGKLQDDVRAILGGRAAAAEAILGRHFTPAVARLEGEINQKTLVGHGKVLTDFEWRLATITASTHGRNLKLPVITLTLKYEEEGRSHAITLNALPSVLRRLREMLGGLIH